ncbi:MAG: hypothetical protein E6K70_11230 [Planctomycetota bacterium]|nr:MAG: hypothetical protein E6K70_11230 [Planctomycetota bacterium]
MIRVSMGSPLLLIVAALICGCNGGGSPSTHAAIDARANSSGARYLLDAEPAGAKGVMEVRKVAGDGDEVVVTGRIGGSPEPFVKGRAAFTIVDSSLVPCNEKAGDTCATPWDYCCNSKEDLARATVLVKLIDAQGQAVAQDAQDLLGVKPMKTVVVGGRAKRDREGNLTVLASHLYVRP